jgi:hypothetical protein
LAEIIYGQLTSQDAGFSTEHLISPRFSIEGIVR